MAPRGADDRVEAGDGRVGVDGVVDEIGEGLAGELVDDVEHLEHPAVGGDVELVVQRPHVIGPMRSEPLGRVSRCPAAGACGAGRDAEASSRHRRWIRLRFTVRALAS